MMQKPGMPVQLAVMNTRAQSICRTLGGNVKCFPSDRTTKLCIFQPLRAIGLSSPWGLLSLCFPSAVLRLSSQTMSQWPRFVSRCFSSTGQGWVMESAHYCFQSILPRLTQMSLSSRFPPWYLVVRSQEKQQIAVVRGVAVKSFGKQTQSGEEQAQTA